MTKYNGWTNHATWDCNLILTGTDEKVYFMFEDMIKSQSKDNIITFIKKSILNFYIKNKIDYIDQVDFNLVNFDEIIDNNK